VLLVTLTGMGESRETGKAVSSLPALMAGAQSQGLPGHRAKAEERAWWHLERRSSAGVGSGLVEVARREAHGRASAEAGPQGHGRLDALRHGVLRRDVL
jgi:hypothetical protein